MSDNSFNKSTESPSEARRPQERKVLNVIEQYLLDAQKAAEAEVKRHPLDYAASLLFGTVAAAVADHYGVDHAINALLASAAVAAAGGTIVTVRRNIRNRKEGLRLPILSEKERGILRRIAMGFASVLRELGNRFNKPALRLLAAALVAIAGFALSEPSSSGRTMFQPGNVVETAAPVASAYPEKFPGLRWSVAYNPPVYSGPVTTVITAKVNSLFPWPENDNA